MRSKTLYERQWVRISPMMNTQFVPVNACCELCRDCSCAPAWYSIKTRLVRCLKCFTPEGYDD